MKEKRYLKTWQYFTFTGGNVGMAMPTNFISSFIIFFYSSFYMGLDVGIIGTLMLMAKLFDGVSDIIFGNIMDRCSHPMGKAKPWVLRGAIPLGITGILLFFLPNSGGWVPYAFFFLFYVLYNAVFYTMTNLAYNSMFALVTTSSAEVVKMNSIGYVIVMLVNILINAGTLGLVKALGNDIAAWRITMIIYTTVGVILLIISMLTVKELSSEELGVEETPEEEVASFKENLKSAVKNPYYGWAILFNLFNNLVITGSTGLLLYFCQINLGDINIYSSLSAVYMFAIIPLLFVSPALVRKFSVYKVNLISSLIMLILSVAAIPAGMSGNTTVFYVLFCLRFVPMGALMPSTMAILPSVVEYSRIQTGKRLEGILYSSASIGYKLAAGIGSAMPGWILAAIGYSASATVQSERAVNGMAAFFYGLPVVIGIIMLVVYYKLDVEKGIERLKKEKGI